MTEITEISHPNIRNGWFYESATFWPGQANALKVKKILHHEKSKYQDILFFESTNYGNVLILDGVVQCTERDEFSYQEMIVHLPMNCHSCPKNVLVIGGGDGGVLREVLKHDCVETVTLCDIDEAVINNSKKYLPKMASAFNNPKVNIHIGDGYQFLKDKSNTYDCIITDTSDPDGPAESLFQISYFELMKNALKEKGVLSIQGENMWLSVETIKNDLKNNKKIFPSADYAYATVPSYPSGQIGFMLCGKSPETNFRKPLRNFSKEFEQTHLKYYNSEIHKSSMIYPQFLKEALADI